jgi:hypothetical protein
MASEKLKKAISEIEDPSVASALRAVNDVLVDGAVQTIATYIVALERARDNGRRELLELSEKLAESRGRHTRWSEEAMHQRELAQASVRRADEQLDEARGGGSVAR